MLIVFFVTFDVVLDDIRILRQLANDVVAGRVKISELHKMNIDETGRGMRRKFQKGERTPDTSEESEVVCLFRLGLATHKHFTALFYGTTRVRRCQKRTLCCNGRLTEAYTQTIQLGATPSGLTSAYLHHAPYFYRPDALPATQSTASSTEDNYRIRPSNFTLNC